MKTIDKVDAIISLVGGGITSQAGGTIVYHDGQTPPSEAEVDAELIRLQAEYDAQAYARKRQAEYPDMGTQFNKIYDDGIDAWKTDMVDPIKAKYPKP